MAEDRSTASWTSWLLPGLFLLVGLAVLIGPHALAARTAPMKDLATYWGTARAWSPGEALPRGVEVALAANAHPTGGPFVYPAWTLMVVEPVSDVPFAALRRALAVILGLAAIGGVGAWLGRAGGRPWTTAGALIVATGALHHAVTTGLVTGNVELLLVLCAGLAVLLADARPEVAGALLGVAAAVKVWPLLLLGAVPRASIRRVTLVAGSVASVLVALDAVLTSTPWGGLGTAWGQLPDDARRSLAGLLRDALPSPFGEVATGLVLVGVAAVVLGAARGGGLRDPTWPALWTLGVLLALPRVLPYTWAFAIGPLGLAWARHPASRLGLVAWVLARDQPADVAMLVAVLFTFGGLAGSMASRPADG